MDVRAAVRSLIPTTPTLTSASETRARDAVQTETHKAEDRDGNGQSADQGDQRRRQLSPEEIAESMKILEAMPGVKEAGLSFELVFQGAGVGGETHTFKEPGEGLIPIVIVRDRDGRVVRRISEADLSLVKAQAVRKTGGLLNRAM
ncbi:MAG TPA: hypothetical protein PLZ57_04665 [Pseudobdellovibrionaceae bacterium]|nr:hypothetical protein [Pseudobdellovibrionaceae bacterium]